MSKGQQLYDQIKLVVDIYDNPHYADFDAVEKPLYIGEQVCHALRHIYASVKGQPDAEYSIEDISDALELFYAEYVAPIDLPMANWLEAIVDNRVPKFFEPGLAALQAKLQSREG